MRFDFYTFFNLVFLNILDTDRPDNSEVASLSSLESVPHDLELTKDPEQINDAWLKERQSLELEISELREQLNQRPVTESAEHVSEEALSVVNNTSIHVQTDNSILSDRMTLDVLGTQWLEEKEMLTATIDELTSQLKDNSEIINKLSNKTMGSMDVDVQTDFTHLLVDQSQQTLTADIGVCQTEFETVGAGFDDSVSLSAHRYCLFDHVSVTLTNIVT